MAQAKSADISSSWVTTRMACGKEDNSSMASAISRLTPTGARPATLLWMARITGSVPDLAASQWRSTSFSSINSVVGNAKTYRPATPAISASSSLVLPHPGGPTSTSTVNNVLLQISRRGVASGRETAEKGCGR